MAEGALPKVSVIIPVFNGTNYLGEAIDSVLSQTYKNYEIIVVDDGSTDETWAVIQSYGSSVRGIHKENGGVASALNYGIRKATGDYIAWLSHDDLFLPEKLQRQVTFLREFKQFKACYTDYYEIDAHGDIVREIETPWYPREQAIPMLFARVYVNGSTMMIERTCFDRMGLFSERWRYTQDTEMWLRMLRQFEIGRVGEKLGKLRVHPSQGSCGIESHNTEAQVMYIEIFEKLLREGVFTEFREFPNNPQVFAMAYTWFADTMAIHHGWFDFADEQYAHAIALYPVWHNPARVKRVGNCVRRFLWPMRQMLAQKIRGAFS